MRSGLEITWRGVRPTEAVEEAVRRKVSQLDRSFDQITSCRVAIERPHQRQRRGVHYCIRIDVTVPGAELVVGHHAAEDAAHEDLAVALRDGFRAMRRKLRDHARQRRGAVKAHEAARDRQDVQ